MRSLLSLLLVTTALPALADTIPATSRITAVTVYPEGAKLTREVIFTVPAAGSHELLVTDLPSVDDLIVARIAGGEGLQVGAYNIRTDRLPPREDPLTPEQEAAKAKVEELEASEQAALLALDAVQARIDAAEAQVRFLSSFSGGLPDGATPETIKAMAAMIGTETLAARETALAARAEYWPVQKALIETQEALTKARDAYAALPSADMDYAALSVAVEAAGAGEQTVTITQYVGGAYWQPTYELNLTREGDDAVSLKRAVLVTQYTGEDWSNVALTLSSSAPSLEASPSSLWPELRSIEPEMTGDDLARMEAVASPAMIEEEVEVVAEKSGPIIAGAAIEGDTVVYNYPNPVTVATGVEDLRLSLDDISFAAVVKAVAVPRRDATAYFVASFVNPSDEPLLPGSAMLYREGVLVGSTELGMIAPGVEAEVGFGAIETLRIKREMPLRE
ncbi:MAG TPA: mucoidy inhibitor MuiA family protein, partial [Tabrizicola sp.]|nr:mucoidy inhibitor MuiA family protein [Tabrizicola sp.]